MALLVLRRRMPLLERAYRTWGYPFTPLFFIISYLYIAARIFISNPFRSALGVFITLSAIPFFHFGVRRVREYGAKATAEVSPTGAADR
jgi:hypothetical protein